MPDMLVKLYNLPDSAHLIAKLRDGYIEIRCPLPPEKHIVINWVRNNFGDGWASECEKTFSTLPVSSYIAVKQGKMMNVP